VVVCGIVLVVCCVILFVSCVCVCDLCLFLQTDFSPMSCIAIVVYTFAVLGAHHRYWGHLCWTHLESGARHPLLLCIYLLSYFEARQGVGASTHRRRATFDRCQVRGVVLRVIVCGVVLVVCCVVLFVSCVCVCDPFLFLRTDVSPIPYIVIVVYSLRARCSPPVLGSPLPDSPRQRCALLTPVVFISVKVPCSY